MRIASWNVNSFKARQDHVQQWLANAKPDLVCLQELKSADFPTEIVNGWGYQVQAVCQKAYNGVAILSRQPVQLIANALPAANDPDNARFLDVDTGAFRILGCYMPNGNPLDSEKFPYKLRWLNALLDYCRDLRHRRVPFVLLGDFNIIPEGLDAHDPKAWINDALFQPEVRKIYRALLALGLSDAYRTLQGHKQEFTFWDYQAGSWQRNAGIRIDHILTSPTMTDALVQCHIDREPRGLDKPSDHTPIIADFVI